MRSISLASPDLQLRIESVAGAPGDAPILDVRLFRRRPDPLVGDCFEAAGGFRVPVDRVEELREALRAEATYAVNLSLWSSEGARRGV